MWIDVFYKGEKVGCQRVDLIVGGGAEAVTVEVKAQASLEDVDLVQALSYLRDSSCRVGLLTISAANQLEIKRLANWKLLSAPSASSVLQ